jgi:hypothetical protein
MGLEEKMAWELAVFDGVQWPTFQTDKDLKGAYISQAKYLIQSLHLVELSENQDLPELSPGEIKRQIKYLYDHNPHLPIEVMLEALCSSIAQAMRDKFKDWKRVK